VAESRNDAQEECDYRPHRGFARDASGGIQWRAALFAEFGAVDDYRQSASGTKARLVKKFRIRHGR
jgi:hypothetical protein